MARVNGPSRLGAAPSEPAFVAAFVEERDCVDVGGWERSVDQDGVMFFHLPEHVGCGDRDALFRDLCLSFEECVVV